MIRLSLLTASFLAMSAAATAQDLTIINGKVWTGTQQGTLENAAIDVRGGEIVGVRENGTSPRGGITVIDAEGKWVTPGIFAPFSRVGLVEVGAEDSTNDISASGTSFTASLQASDGFNPAASTIPVTRIEGVTRMAVTPGNGGSMIAGQGFIANTSGGSNSVTTERAFMFIDLGEGGASASGGSRPAMWATLRGALSDARNPLQYTTHREGDTLSRVDARAFASAARGEQLILVSAHRASDLRQIIRLKQDYPTLDLAIVGADEGWIVANELAVSGIPVIIDPFQNLPASFAQLGATSKNAERLIAAGVPTAFSHIDSSGHQTRLTLQSAGNAVANGVDFDDAMAAITVIPALIYGETDLGTIEAGKIADLVIWDGDPLDVMTSTDVVIIDGVVQSLESRQTRLRDRYLDLDETEQPLAYRR